ncbi:MAG: Gfo/Idh/MocA family oxidoreductase [bacterium]|nr:Gfo/Idh/MocA family oxidoreductase [bacterium]
MTTLLVVGCGSIGGRHARNLVALGAGPVACCDLDAARAARLAAECGGGASGADLGAMLARVRPDAVLVCTPPSTHLALAHQALAAGAHVFCEKPLADAMDGVDALVEAAEGSGRVFMMGMCYRFHPGLRRMAALLRAGVVGRIQGAQMWAGHWLPDWHPWADYRREYSAQRRLGGGVLLDSIHSFDTLRWVLGEPVAVTGMLAQVSDLEIDVEDVAAALVRLASGVIVEVHVDYLQRHPESRFEVIGSEGNLVWTKSTLRWRCVADDGWEEEVVAVDPNAMYLDELRAFLRAVRTGEAVALGVREGRRTLALALAVRASAESGRTMRIDGPVQAPLARVSAVEVRP